ncbi:MAG: AAA family ATPase [Endozoicomonas sp.]|uniref:AAA family ATPase n=1 Tax=Endozoicomonas sp. TaxID=1892382 RepID=UPI003D9B98B2
MLNSIRIENLTAFQDAQLQLCPGINIIVGENGCGKSHLLKAAYASLATGVLDARKSPGTAPSKGKLQSAYGEKLVNVFRPEKLGGIVSNKSIQSCTMSFECTNSQHSVSFEFSARAETEVKINQLPKRWNSEKVVFFPARELMTSYAWLPNTYKNHYLEIDEAYVDTCDLLGALPVKGSREVEAKALLKPLEDAMGGTLVLDKNGRFYLQTGLGRKIEISLLAEGLRKLAMIARLIANGTLLSSGLLFWDEPEANLNPKLIKLLAKSILDLSMNGVQVVCATHSLFLLREIELMASKPVYHNLPQRYFALKPGGDSRVSVEQGGAVDDLETLVLLDEELAQSDRYMEAE